MSVADTIGVGRPQQIQDLFDALADVGDVATMAFHGHDTYGMGLANSLAAVDAGVTTIDEVRRVTQEQIQTQQLSDNNPASATTDSADDEKQGEREAESPLGAISRLMPRN